MRGFPSQDEGPGMNQLFHDLQVEQEERKMFDKEMRDALLADAEKLARATAITAKASISTKFARTIGQGN